MKKSKVSLLVVLIFVFSLFSTNAFAISDDHVLSQNIREADGTSGQDTNSGSGIKTGHIQDGAVTTGKVADGSISTSKIVDGAVTTPKIADGTVTDAKITGPISASKISSTGLNADTVDGKHAADFEPNVHEHSGADITSGTIPVDRLATYANTRVVHKGSADGIHTFNTISDALASITDASEANPYTVYVMPGVYVEYIHTKDYVSIKGAGKDVTKITSSVYPNNWQGTVSIVTNNSPIEGLTIENTNTVSSVAIESFSGAIISDCRIVSTGSNTAYGIVLGLIKYEIKNSEIHITATTDATGIVTMVTGSPGVTGSVIENNRIYVGAGSNAMGIHINNDSGVDIINTHVTVNGGSGSWTWALRSFGSGTIIRASDSSFTTIGGIGASIAVWSGGTLKAADCRLEGPIELGWGTVTLKLVNCYDKNFNPIPNR